MVKSGSGRLRCLSVTRTNGALQFTWSTVANFNYQLQYALDLGAPDWHNLGNPVRADGATLSSVDPIQPDSQRFYRIVVSP